VSCAKVGEDIQNFKGVVYNRKRESIAYANLKLSY